ncbi:hypothetical protein [Actinoplanes sp. G11-F43]|uniref:hypothetical protein n=1 Tax=Actinoplanes sp. G11-F43 TaxID=3424130 RepID=UPI003D32FF4E
MAADVDVVRKALRATMLADLPITPAPGDCLMISGLDPADVLPAWRTAHAAMPSTGRRPLLLDRAPTGVAFTTPDAREDPWPALARPWWDLPLTGDTPQVPGFLTIDVRRDVPDPTTRTVNRYVYERVRADSGLRGLVPPYADRLTGIRNWQRPERVELLLPPTTEAHLPAAWTGLPPAVLRCWYEQWRAELVAAWDGARQFVVGRRPETADDAFTLACQIATVAGRLEMNLWEIALAVTDGEEWILT